MFVVGAEACAEAFRGLSEQLKKMKKTIEEAFMPVIDLSELPPLSSYDQAMEQHKRFLGRIPYRSPYR